MVVAGLTGGIATGKSTVAGFFVSAGAHLIDADRIAFDAVCKGTDVWHEIVEHFGEGVLGHDGQIDRVFLGDIVFNDHSEKACLDSIVHPKVHEEILLRISRLEQDFPGSVVIVDVPLLIEADMYRDMSEVILVYAPEHIQLARLMARNRLSKEDAMARIGSQMSIEEKKAYASIIIDNSGSLDRTREQTLSVYDALRIKAYTQQG